MSEISGIFFFHSGGKKKYSIISHREKNTGLFFPKIVDFRQKKNSVIFLSYRPPYFCQNCEFQMRKPTSYLGQNWGSQTEIKKYRLIFVKTVPSTEIRKDPLFSPKSSKSCAGKKKYRDAWKGKIEGDSMFLWKLRKFLKVRS